MDLPASNSHPCLTIVNEYERISPLFAFFTSWSRNFFPDAIQRFPKQSAVLLSQQIFLTIPSYLVTHIKVLETYHVSCFSLSSFLFTLQTMEIRCNLMLYLAFKDWVLENLCLAHVLFDRHAKVRFKIASVIDSTSQSTWDLASQDMSYATDKAHGIREWICQQASLDSPCACPQSIWGLPTGS